MPHIRSLDALHIDPFPGEFSFPGRVAAIDLGSNSLRLVIYNVRGRYFYAEHNEKIQCGLAYGIDEDGKIDDDRIEEAKRALSRFMAVARCRAARQIVLFATSALRDAVNADIFLNWARQRFGIEIKVLTGKEEAVYAALGIVQAFAPERAVVADMGGGSLELCALSGGADVCAPASLPIGPLRFVPDGAFTDKKAAEAAQALNAAFPFAAYSGAPLYAVGGAFRNIAKFHILRTGYPLHILDYYRVTPEELRPTLEMLRHASREETAGYKTLARKRAPYIPYVAYILDTLTALTGAPEIYFSAGGVREGVVYSMLPEDVRKQSVPAAAAAEMRPALNLDGAYTDALCDKLECFRTLCGMTSEEMRLLCGLKEYTASHYGDFRGDTVFHNTLFSPFLPLPHPRRVFVTLALVCAYLSDMNEVTALTGDMLNLLPEQERFNARLAGKALKAARALTGNCPQALRLTRFALDKDGRRVHIRYNEAVADMLTDGAVKKLHAPGAMLGYDTVIEKIA